MLERPIMDNPVENTESKEQPELSRRKALIKLGLAAGVTTYVAPLMTNLSKANAVSCPAGQHLVHGMCV
jgi:hypothetical protein